MKLFSTLIQRIATIVVVLVMAFTVNAERTFATLAEMHAATDLVAGDVVTITNDVVVEYAINYRSLKAELSNGMELVFDHEGHFVRIDD